jgi:predicted PhzF superfamily epimerase YddE/YHI9
LKKFDPDGQYLSGIILTVKGTTEGGFVDERGIPYDFASRFFPPWLGLSEDPATGSIKIIL